MKFDDVQLQILPRVGPAETPTFEVAFQSQKEGIRQSPLDLTWKPDEVPQQLEIIGAVLLRWMEHVALGKGTKAEHEATREQLDVLFRATGTDLFRGLLTGEVLASMERHWRTVDRPTDGDGLRLRLLFDPNAPELAPFAALPWELLYRPETDDFVGRLRRAQLVRYLENRRAIPDLMVEGDIKVLLVASSPKNLRAINSGEEITEIREAVAGIQGIHIDVYEKPELGMLRRRLIDGGYHVLHFMGHGSFHQQTSEGMLAFVGEDGKYKAQPAHRLAENFKGLKDLRLVVLSSCWGAALPRKIGQSPYVNMAPALVMAGVPAVVAMQFPITDTAAKLFSKAFYRALVRADPLDVALAEARLEIHSHDETTYEWATPALFTRVRNCQILERRVVVASPPPATPPIPDRPIPEGALHLGLRSFAEGWGKQMEERCEMLDLGEFFDPATDHRLIFDDASWQAVIAPRVRSFLRRVEDEKPLVLEIAAHNSIAFFAGSVLDAKSGIDVTVRQRAQGRSHHWSALEGQSPDGPLWQLGEIPIGQGTDTAFAVGITYDIAADVEDYVHRAGLEVGRITVANVLPKPGPRSIQSGAHALELSHQLSRIIRQRTVEERRGVLHLFTSAPAVFMVWLGQQAKAFGAIQLYEHDFESGLPGAYLPSLRITPPRWHHSA